MTNELTTVHLPANRPTPQEIFDYPEYTIRGIETWEEIALLGRKNIDALIARCRSTERGLTDRIQRLKEEQKLLEGKTGTDFEEMAKEYENPSFTDVGVPSDSWSKDLEPLDAESKTRERGATTFNVCGWCPHASGGTGRYSFMITTRCGLLQEGAPDTAFNTPCLLHDMNAERFAAIVEVIKRKIEGVKEHREQVRVGIRILQKLKEGATEKPYLMTLRPHDHFNVGDDVMVHIGGWDNVIVEGDWVPAMVVFGYRHHDGFVSYQTLFPIHSNVEYLEGRGGGAGMSRPEALLRSEFCYLRDAFENDPEFLRLWLGSIGDSLKDFDLDGFGSALKEGELAEAPADWNPPVDEIAVRSVEDAGHVLQMLDPNLFKTEKEIRDWANMQLRHVHPDKLAKHGDNVQSYAARQTKAVYAARDLLIQRLQDRQS